MDLLKFSGREIHGYLDIDIEFNDQLTFLTGINGGGKTTALNCIVSMLFPKIQFLCDLSFMSMTGRRNLFGANEPKRELR